MATTPEPINWNEVRAYFESQDNTIGVIADGVADLMRRFGSFEARLVHIEDDVQFMKPILRTLAPVPNTLERIEKRLDSFDERLKVVEAK